MSTTEQQGRVAELADETKHVVSARTAEAAEAGRSQIRRQVDQRAGQAAEQIAAVGEALRTGAGDLRSNGKSSQATLVEQGADHIERLADHLRRSDAEQLLSEAEAFARRRPMLVTAAGMAAGFGLARMLKASSGTRYLRTEPDWRSRQLAPQGQQTWPAQQMTPSGSVRG
jgi:ethanolamine utilization microcompartment shell protein EutL